MSEAADSELSLEKLAENQDSQQGTQRELSKDEELASRRGWTPLEDWEAKGKDPADWKSARSFIEHGELMDRIQRQGAGIERYKQELAEVKDTTKQMAQHFAKMIKIEREKVLKDLKHQKVRALKADEQELVVEIDEQIREAEKTFDVPEVKEETPEQKIVKDWMEQPENSWYQEDFEMAETADRYFVWGCRTKKWSVEKALQETEKHIKKKFSDRFSPDTLDDDEDDEPPATPRKSGKVAEFRRQSSSATPSKKYSVRDLSKAERQICTEFVEMGVYKNEQEYVDSLTASGYFKNKR